MSAPGTDARSKIRDHHLNRVAYVYVRQSSAFQVEHHRESQRRQYNLVDWVASAGWPKERIVIVDEDQGKSGAVAFTRTGFGNMVAAVGRGEVGIIASLEVSRLARNSPDWSHLVYVCRWTQTLIVDENGVYDPSLSADRMVLGIRGQVSELELETSIHRMVEARWTKARRGEMMTIPPAGYEIDDPNQLVITSDEAVAHAIRTVFTKFDELGSGRRVLLSLITASIPALGAERQHMTSHNLGCDFRYSHGRTSRSPREMDVPGWRVAAQTPSASLEADPQRARGQTLITSHMAIRRTPRPTGISVTEGQADSPQRAQRSQRALLGGGDANEKIALRGRTQDTRRTRSGRRRTPRRARYRRFSEFPPSGREACAPRDILHRGIASVISRV